MTEPFDWADLSHEAASIRYIHGNLAAAAYLRERIEAAFVPRIGAQKVIDFGAEQAARAEAAEAREAKLREALRPFVESVVILPTGDIVGLERHHFQNARAALGEDHDK